MPLLSSTTAAGFKIVRLLGCGPTGDVYLAEHPRLPRRHVLKVLPADVSADPEYRERFNRESDRAAALWHPHIVGLHDRGEFEGHLWLSVDYVDGASAAQLLSDSYPDGMPPEEVVEIVSAIADALDYAHDHGLLHRHVKPGNILIAQAAQAESGRRRIFLADLGVPRHFDDINGSAQTSITVDTVIYAAPEQLMGGSIDGRADQYALAATAFHLLTGSPPFAHSNPAVVISKHLTEPPPRPGDVKPELGHFDETLFRALAKDPGDRFPRCQDFAKALEADHRNLSDLRDAEATAAVIHPAPSPVREPASAVVTPRQDDGDAAWLTEPMAAARPDTEPDDVVTSPQPEIGDAETSAAPVVFGATSADSPARSGGRLLPRAAAFVLAIVVVVVGFFIVMALRLRSEFQPAPTNSETPPSATTTPPPVPTTATPLPSTATPIPAATPPLTTPPSPTSTSSPAATKSPTVTHMPPTSMAPSPSPTTMSPSPSPTTPAGIDNRPAVGIPCTPQQAGATAIANSGAPIYCVGTPGGFAWQPAGG
ncbi:MAG TPA: serine/threonine-protein kinase [Mycobacterium sp.]|uniref:serine/threonine-protein kinase n=1 Tax=Mycobacterium sp. TaxID=1785 RepID=UPI002D6BF869|nr:serine/threonine-protein kinase [Mycobacterium sp.]HZU45716.1 serine/threonine-protein kinase [Mycobacterium sp.]